MRIKITLDFSDKSSRLWPKAQEFFRKIGRDDLVDAPIKEHAYNFVFYDEEKKMQSILREAEKSGFDKKISFQKEYTINELRSFPLLRFIVNTAPKGDGGPRYGTKYDISEACPQCLSGAEQISPLILNATGISLKKSVAQTYSHEILVSPELAQAFQDEKVTGLKMLEVISRKGAKLPWFQLLSDYELPPMSLSSIGIIRSTSEWGQAPCTRCGRDGYFDTHKISSEIHYDKSRIDIHSLPDILRTYENFGKGKIRTPFEKSVLAHPLIIINPRIFDILRSLKVRGVAFEPVIIE